MRQNVHDIAPAQDLQVDREPLGMPDLLGVRLRHSPPLATAAPVAAAAGDMACDPESPDLS